MGGIVFDFRGGEADLGVGGRFCRSAGGPLDEAIVLVLMIAEIKFS